MNWLEWLARYLAPARFDEPGGLLPIVQRSSQWDQVRDWHLILEPECQLCGTRKTLEVHHKVPVHVDASRELDLSNLITLCRIHHLIFGHLGSWKSWNENVDEDVALWHDRYKWRP